jgi:hypothetical protein
MQGFAAIRVSAVTTKTRSLLGEAEYYPKRGMIAAMQWNVLGVRRL